MFHKRRSAWNYRWSSKNPFCKMYGQNTVKKIKMAEKWIFLAIFYTFLNTSTTLELIKKYFFIQTNFVFWFSSATLEQQKLNKLSFLLKKLLWIKLLLWSMRPKSRLHLFMQQRPSTVVRRKDRADRSITVRKIKVRMTKVRANSVRTTLVVPRILK